MTTRRPHIPVRQCSGCNVRDVRTSMDRFALVDGRLAWEPSQGRGGYLHRRAECREAFVRRKPFIRSLKTAVSKPERDRLVHAAVSHQGSRNAE